MEKQVEKSFVWVIKNPTSLSPSDLFLIAGCKWCLVASPKKNNIEFFNQYQGVADSHSLPSRWRRYVKLRLNIMNQLSDKLSIETDSEFYMNETSPMCRYPTVLPPSKLTAKNGGFLVNGQLMIVVKEIAHDVIGTLGEIEESAILSRREESHGGKFFFNMNESIDVYGFQVLPSQVESVRRIIKKHPDFASRFSFNNRHLKSTYMNVLLGLIETLCQSPEELSNDVLDEASFAVSYVSKGGFQVDWLEKKIEEVRQKKADMILKNAYLQEVEKRFQKLNKECLELKAHMDKEKADLSADNAPLSFDDVV